MLWFCEVYSWEKVLNIEVRKRILMIRNDFNFRGVILNVLIVLLYIVVGYI